MGEDKLKGLQTKEKRITPNKKLRIILLLIVFFYGLSIVIYSVTETSASYIPKPHFDNDTPSEFKQLFFMQSHDGEDMLSPIKYDGIIFHGSRSEKKVALTFDADMTPGMKDQLISGNVHSHYDSQLITTLEQTQTKATLFLSGMWIEMYPDIAKKLAANTLFELGNHSYSHPAFSGYCYGLRPIALGDERQEIGKTQQLLYKLTKTKNQLFRFPGGCYSQKDIDILRDEEILGIQWDVVGGDGFNHDAQNIADNVINNVQNGSIVVMHMNGYPNDPKTTEALSSIIANLKGRGFEFVTVSELLNEKKATQILPLFLTQSSL